MDVKSRVISKIDSLRVGYEEEDSGPITQDRVKRHHAILGAVNALGFIEGQIQSLDPDGFEVMGIVETSRSEIRTLRYAKSFLSQVLFTIELAREHRRLDGTIGSGYHPDAVEGREEACDQMTNFVFELNEELTDNQ